MPSDSDEDKQISSMGDDITAETHEDIWACFHEIVDATEEDSSATSESDAHTNVVSPSPSGTSFDSSMNIGNKRSSTMKAKKNTVINDSKNYLSVKPISRTNEPLKWWGNNMH